MSTLHIVRSSPFENNELSHCLRLIIEDDALLLIDDGCYALKHPSIELAKKKNIKIYVLSTHAQARAIEVHLDQAAITLDEVVTLTFENKRVITWQ